MVFVYVKRFTGCNTWWILFMIVNIFFRIINLLNPNTSSEKITILFETAGVLIILENIAWMIAIFLELKGLKNLDKVSLLIYNKLLFLGMFLDTIASIIIFISFNEFDTTMKASFIILWILTICC